MTKPICKDTTNELLVNIVGLKQHLDRTRKALDVAVDALKEIQDKGEYVNPIYIATSCLEQITALEQKDVE